METVALRTTPPATALVLDHARNLVIRFRWELLVSAVFIALYQFTALINPDTLDPGMPRPFIDGAVGFPASFLFTLLAAYWAFRVWSDIPPGQRPVFSAYPVGQPKHNAIRITAGAGIILLVLPVAWILGALICEIAAPGRSILSLDAYSGWGFIITFIGFLNAYLFGSILAILLKRPEQWFLWLIFATIALPGAILFGLKLKYDGLVEILGWLLGRLIGEPVGIFLGFGIPVDIGASSGLPGLEVVLLWTTLLVAGIYASSRIHMDN